jgi:hypothetical protein
MVQLQTVHSKKILQNSTLQNRTVKKWYITKRYTDIVILYNHYITVTINRAPLIYVLIRH